MTLAIEDVALRESVPVYLYRWFDEAGALLYVGITKNPAARAKAHKHYSFWFTFAHMVTYSSEPIATNRADAEKIELATIQADRPIFNRMGARGRHVSRGLAYLSGRGIDPNDDFWVARLPSDLGGDPTRRPVSSLITDDEIDEVADDLMAIHTAYLAQVEVMQAMAANRRTAVQDARASGWSKYMIGKHLGIHVNVVTAILNAAEKE